MNVVAGHYDLCAASLLPETVRRGWEGRDGVVVVVLRKMKINPNYARRVRKLEGARCFAYIGRGKKSVAA
jgi:hypothetical protein